MTSEHGRCTVCGAPLPDGGSGNSVCPQCAAGSCRGAEPVPPEINPGAFDRATSFLIYTLSLPERLSPLLGEEFLPPLAYNDCWQPMAGKSAWPEA